MTAKLIIASSVPLKRIEVDLEINTWVENHPNEIGRQAITLSARPCPLPDLQSGKTPVNMIVSQR